MRGENGKIYTLEFHSELTQETKSFDLVDTGSGGYYIFTLDTSSIAPGEYNYTLYDSAGEIVAKGLAVCNIEESRPDFIQYDITANFKVIQYVPSYELPKYMVISTTATAIPSTDTSVIFKVLSNEEGRITVYKDNEYWTDMPFGSGQTTLAFAFPENTSMKDNVIFRIEGTTDSGKASDSVEITQEKLVFDWKLLPGPQTIPAEQDYISWSVERNTTEPMHLKITLLYEGEYSNRQEYEFSSYSIASYFSIRPNSSPYKDLHYTVIAELNGETKSFEVKQEKSTDHSHQRFTIEMLEDGDIEWDGNGYNYYDIIRNGEIYDEGSQLDHGVFGLLRGDKVEFYVQQDVPSGYSGVSIYSLAKHNVSGNIMSLLYEDYVNNNTLRYGVFWGLFNGDSGLISAENLKLPATTLAQACYSSMFQDCINLVSVPELPATTLAAWCYMNMFQGCTSLENAPELPATTLSDTCYSYMFAGCTALEVAPALPATNLAETCYNCMFSGCTSLTTAPELLATTLAKGCYFDMFNRCISLTEAPELPATTLVESCYTQMFSRCSKLNYVKCLATDNSASNSTYRWLYGVAPTGTFFKANEMEDWTSGTSGIPNGWTVLNSDR